jgi:hypothetical protein
MMTWMKRWGIPAAAVLVVVAGVILQVVAKMQPVPESSLKAPLKELIPLDLAGWTVEDMDLGPTESVTQRSHDLLNLDDRTAAGQKRPGSAQTGNGIFRKQSMGWPFNLANGESTN